MDAVARVQARMFEVQARFGRVAGAAVAPVASSNTASNRSGGASEAASGASFREIADAAMRSVATSADSLGTTSTLRAASRAPGSFGTITLPASLRGRRNGELSNDVLEPIGQGNHRLERTAAVAFRRMAAAAAQDGVTLRVSDSYRSLDDQTRTAGDVGLYRDGGLAAVPGTSTHGWGLSIDVEVDAKTQQWLRTNANRFGFAEDVAREPWHYTYRPADL